MSAKKGEVHNLGDVSTTGITEAPKSSYDAARDRARTEQQQIAPPQALTRDSRQQSGGIPGCCKELIQGALASIQERFKIKAEDKGKRRATDTSDTGGELSELEMFQKQRTKYLEQVSTLQKKENYSSFHKIHETLNEIDIMSKWLAENKQHFKPLNSKKKREFQAVKRAFDTEQGMETLVGGPRDEKKWNKRERIAKSVSVAFLEEIKERLRPPQADSSQEAGTSRPRTIQFAE